MSVGALRRLAQPRPEPPQVVEEERCDLCAEPLGPRHRHLLDVQERRIMCACRPCSILFDSAAAGGGHFRLLPERVRVLDDFRLDDRLWQGLRIPVDLAFFFESSAAGKVVAFYPAPVGATESLLELDAWEELVAANPVLAELEPDVEALLVDRRPGRREHWLVPVDRCYALVGLIMSRWKGLAGGQEVWEELGEFFSALHREAEVVSKEREEVRG